MRNQIRSLVIRRATTADLPPLGRLGALLVQQHHDFDSRRFLGASRSTPHHYAEFLGSQLDDPDVLVLVAEHEGQVIGYTFSAMEGYDYKSLRGPAGLLHDIVVDPDHRGRGIGSRLLAETLSMLQSKGARQIVLSTAERNESAQRLFARMGFRRTMIEMTREMDEPVAPPLKRDARL
jgi:ribosomal protein S18 acetylase RimI-like enzyme